MDVTFVTPEGTFNYRVCAVIIHDNHLLAMQDERSPYYYLPGGRVHLGETLESAIHREMREELGFSGLILRPLWLCENFFVEDVNRQHYHCLLYTSKLTDFVDDLSNWYIRLGRDRFWGKGMEGDKEAAFITLYTVLSTLCRLIAPFVPFMSESIYQNIVRTVDHSAPESVHLCDFPVCDERMIDTDAERQMAAVENVVQLGRACRNLSNIKVRQPLSILLSLIHI